MPLQVFQQPREVILEVPGQTRFVGLLIEAKIFEADKCNLDELRMIAQIADRDDSAVRPAAEELMKDHDIELLIATDGKNGATVFEKGGNVLSAMKRLDTADIEDTVGAGDAFSSVFII